MIDLLKSPNLFALVLILMLPILWPLLFFQDGPGVPQARAAESDARCRRAVSASAAAGDMRSLEESVLEWTTACPSSAAAGEVSVVLSATTMTSSQKFAFALARAGGNP